jgi:outer membrane immunogenic protein
VKYRMAFALIATCCMAGATFAADLPTSGPYRPGPFMVRQPVEWTGLYFGANAGYGWGQYSSNITFTGLGASGLTNAVPGLGPGGIAGGIIAVGGPTELSGTRIIGSGSPGGAIAGGQIGFNWQAGMFVFGGEIDGQWSGQENTFTVACGPRCSATESIKIRSIATGRGRFGLAFDWIMPYVTGGAALVNGLNNLNMTVAGTSASFLPLSHSTLGWTAGAGVEVALWSNWSAKFEYLYVSANGATKVAFIPNALGLGFASTPGDYRDNIVRVGFNYRFGPRGGPGLLESPLPARDTYAFNSDFLPQFASDRANMRVATRSPDQPHTKTTHAVAVRNAPSAGEAPMLASTQVAPRQAAPRQVASAVNDLPAVADDDVIYTDDFVTDGKPAKQVAKKRSYKEEDESARMKRIMSICSGC